MTMIDPAAMRGAGVTPAAPAPRSPAQLLLERLLAVRNRLVESLGTLDGALVDLRGPRSPSEISGSREGQTQHQFAGAAEALVDELEMISTQIEASAKELAAWF